MKANGGRFVRKLIAARRAESELTYDDAVRITDQAKANAYFERLVKRTLSLNPELDRTEAEEIQRTNIGYWAGYHDIATRIRVYKLYKAVHPIFGMDFDPLPGEAFAAGIEDGMKLVDVKQQP